MVQVSTFADMEGEETFEASLLGQAEEVAEERIADDDVIMIKGTKTTSAVCCYLTFHLVPPFRCIFEYQFLDYDSYRPYPLTLIFSLSGFSDT